MRLSTLLVSNFSLANASVNGGSGCYTCMIVTSWIDQYTRSNQLSYENGLNDVCFILPDILGTLCKQVQNEFGDYIVEAFKIGHSPDTLCHCLGNCRVDDGQEMCHFYPLPTESPVCPIMDESKLDSVKNGLRETLVDWCKDHQNIEVCQGLNNLVDGLELIADRLDRHVAAKDDDDDGFSDIGALRGYWWKGTDFEDEDNQVYPGRFPENGDEYYDSNCNNLEGRIQDPENPGQTVPLENLLCDDYQQMGVAILGDSAGAHFSLPVDWMRPYNWTVDSRPFSDWKIAVGNELDWPMMSAFTGFTDKCWSNAPNTFIQDTNVDSIYSRLVKRNRCNLNDYQNQANNGCKAKSMADKTIFGLNRKPTDKPMLVFLSLIGNDVCNGKVNTEDFMTTPEEFKLKTTESLEYLDTILPQGSGVVVTGLAQGAILWDTLHDRLYPFGEFDGAGTYSDFYGYMECLQVSPCMGWMSADPERRARTTKREQELSQAAEELVNEQKDSYKFKLVYTEYPLEKVKDEYVKNGGEAWHLMEGTVTSLNILNGYYRSFSKVHEP